MNLISGSYGLLVIHSFIRLWRGQVESQTRAIVGRKKTMAEGEKAGHAP